MDNRWIRRCGLQLTIVAMVLLACILVHLMASGNRSIVERRDMARRELVLLRQENDERSLADLPWMLAQLDVDKERRGKIIESRTRPELIVPTTRVYAVDEFIANLAATTERLVNLAQEFGVVLRGDGYFGFSDIMQRGHISEKMAHRDNVEAYEIAALLQLLFESSSGDLYFVGIEREATLPTDLVTCRNDFFDASYVAAIRKGLSVNSHLYRLRFRSKTDTFRNFLNALEDNLMPVVPHNMVIGTPKRTSRRDGGNRSVVVHSGPTEFSIVLEWIHIPSGEEEGNRTKAK